MGVRGTGLVPVSDSPFCCGAISGSYLRFVYNEVDLLDAVRECERHHNTYRPHRGIANTRPLGPLPDPITEPAALTPLRIHRRDRLGGLLHEYDQAA
jgi:hypothetical protein